MKKNLTFLTGIVFLIAILVAVGCGNSSKKNNSPEVENVSSQDAGVPKVTQDDPTKVDVFLKDSIVNEKTHLFISDSRKLDSGVFDDHFLIVRRGHTIRWKKNVQGSNIHKILSIRAVGTDTTFFGASPEPEPGTIGIEEAFERGVYKLTIPETAPLDTLVKYEIIFTVKNDTTIYIIDPYLQVPPTP